MKNRQWAEGCLCPACILHPNCKPSSVLHHHIQVHSTASVAQPVPAALELAASVWKSKIWEVLLRQPRGGVETALHWAFCMLFIQLTGSKSLMSWGLDGPVFKSWGSWQLELLLTSNREPSPCLQQWRKPISPDFLPTHSQQSKPDSYKLQFCWEYFFYIFETNNETLHMCLD